MFGILLEWDPGQVISVVPESPTGGCPHLYRGFQYFWKFNGLFHTFSKILGYLPSSSQSLLSSLLRYTQPYGRATITFSFRQFSFLTCAPIIFICDDAIFSPLLPAK